MCPTCGRPYKINPQEVREMYKIAKTMQEIGDFLGVTKQSIWRYLQGSEFEEIKQKNFKRGKKTFRNEWVKRDKDFLDEILAKEALREAARGSNEMQREFTEVEE